MPRPRRTSPTALFAFSGLLFVIAAGMVLGHFLGTPHFRTRSFVSVNGGSLIPFDGIGASASEAAAAADARAAAFVAEAEAAARASVESELKDVLARRAAYREELATAENRLANEERGTVEARTAQVLARGLEARLARARQERAAIESVWRRIERAGSPLDAPPVAADFAVQQARRQVLVLERRRSELLQRYAAGHPEVQRLEAALASQRQALDAAVAQIVESYWREFAAAAQVEQTLAGDLARTQRQVAQGQEATLSAALAASRLSAARDTDVAMAQQEQRLRERLVSATSGARIVERASLPRRSGPGPWPYAVAVGGGLLAAAGVRAGRRRSRVAVPRGERRRSGERRRITRRQPPAADPALDPLRWPATAPAARRPSSSEARRSS